MTFELKQISSTAQADFKADGRMRAYLAMKRAFKKRSKESGVTLQSLSKAIGRDKGQISKVLAGTNAGITLDTLVLITSALGFRVSFEVEAIESMKKKNRNVAPLPPTLVTLKSKETFPNTVVYISGDLRPKTSGSFAYVAGSNK